MSAARRAAWAAVVPLLLLAAWEASARAGIAPHFLSSPAAVLSAFDEMLADGEFLQHASSSGLRLGFGLLFGATLGLLAGVAAGRVGAVRWVLDPLVSFVNPIPKIAFLPIVILAAGLGHESKIAIVTLSVSFPVYLAAENATRSVEERLLWAARNAGAGRLRIFAEVILPAAAPGIISGLRVGIALSFISLFAAELMGAADGLGQLIAAGEEYQRYDIMLAAIFAFAVAGYGADRLLLLGSRLFLRGQRFEPAGRV